MTELNAALELVILVDLKKPVHHQEEKVEKPARSKKSKDELDTFVFNVDPPVPIQGDIKMELSEKQVNFAWSFNTGFVASQWKPEGPYNLVIPQAELDKALKDKQNKIFPKGFRIEVTFSMLESDLAEQGDVYAVHGGDAAVKSPTLSVNNESKMLDMPNQSASSDTRYFDLLYKYPSLSNY